MSKKHLFSRSLFNTLFQHNIISADGYVKATDKQLLAFREFLVQQARDKTTELYKKRKEMVDEVTGLLRKDELSSKETERLLLLLHKLNLKISAEGFREDDEPPGRKHTNLGASEPNKSKFDREMLAEEKRLKELRRDLQNLDDWLEEINKPDNRVNKPAVKSPKDSKKDELRFRERTARRNKDMERARQRLISNYHAANAKSLKHTLAKKDNPGRVRFKKDAGASRSTEDDFALKIRKSVATERIDVQPVVVRDIDERFKKEAGTSTSTDEESFETADSHFSSPFHTLYRVTQKERNLAKKLKKPPSEDEFALKIRKSVATERIDVHPGVVRDIDEDTKLRPTKGVTTYGSEPIMETTKDPSVNTVKDKNYNSESSLDDKANSISPTLDEAKQRIITGEDGGIDTQFSVEDKESGSNEKKYKLDNSRVPSDKKHKTILKASRKRIDQASSPGTKKLGNIIPRENKQGIKNLTMNNKDQKNKRLPKYQSAEKRKDRKSSDSTILLRNKVPPVTQRAEKMEPVLHVNDSMKDNLPKIISSKCNKKETGHPMKTKDSLDKNQNLARLPFENRLNLKNGKMVNKPLSKTKAKEDGLSLEKQLNLKADFESAQHSNPSQDGRNLATINQRKIKVNPTEEEKVKNKSKNDNQPNILTFKYNNNENGRVLKSKDSVNKNTNPQFKKRPNQNITKVKNKNIQNSTKKQSKEDINRLKGGAENNSQIPSKLSDSSKYVEHRNNHMESQSSERTKNIPHNFGPPSVAKNVTKIPEEMSIASENTESQNNAVEPKNNYEIEHKGETVNISRKQNFDLEAEINITGTQRSKNENPQSDNKKIIKSPVRNNGATEKDKNQYRTLVPKCNQKADNTKENENLSLDPKLGLGIETNAKGNKSLNIDRSVSDNNIKRHVGINGSSENFKPQNNTIVPETSNETEEKRGISLEQKLSLESEMNDRRKKKCSPNVNVPENNLEYNIKTPSRINGSRENPKLENNLVETQSNNETEISEKNGGHSPDQKLSLENETNAGLKKRCSSNTDGLKNAAKKNVKSPVGTNGFLENSEPEKNSVETKSDNEAEITAENRGFSLDQKFSLESELIAGLKKKCSSNTDESKNDAKKNIKSPTETHISLENVKPEKNSVGTKSDNEAEIIAGNRGLSPDQKFSLESELNARLKKNCSSNTDRSKKDAKENIKSPAHVSLENLKPEKNSGETKRDNETEITEENGGLSPDQKFSLESEIKSREKKINSSNTDRAKSDDKNKIKSIARINCSSENVKPQNDLVVPNSNNETESTEIKEGLNTLSETKFGK